MTINDQAQFSSNLPKAYQLAPKGNQKCSNCSFYENTGNCSLWDAIVQPFAWCKKWKGVVNAT
jgi:hypothetical protein